MLFLFIYDYKAKIHKIILIYHTQIKWEIAPRNTFQIYVKFQFANILTFSTFRVMLSAIQHLNIFTCASVINLWSKGCNWIQIR